MSGWKTGINIVAVAAGVFAASATAHAQTLGLEAGVAAVSNQPSVGFSFGASVFWPVGQTFVGGITYSQWSDESTSTDDESAGRRGLNMSLLGRLIGNDRISLLIGGGLGQYEVFRDVEGESERDYTGALTLSTMVVFAVSESTSFYLKGDVSAPTFESEPGWGFARGGIAFRLF